MVAGSSDSPLELLLVEDNPGDAKLIKTWLAALKARIDHVTDLARATERAEDVEYDVVLLDLGLPDSRGLDGVTQLRERNERTAIVVLTGLDDPSIASEAVEQGAQEYLPKSSLDSTALSMAIDRAIRRQRLLLGYGRLVRSAQDRSNCLEQLLNLHRSGILVADSHRRILWANAAAQVVTGCRQGGYLPPELGTHGSWSGRITVLGGEVDVRAFPIRWSDDSEARFIELTLPERGKLARHQPSPTVDALIRATADAMHWRAQHLLDAIRTDLGYHANGSEALSCCLDLCFFVDEISRLTKGMDDGPH